MKDVEIYAILNTSGLIIIGTGCLLLMYNIFVPIVFFQPKGDISVISFLSDLFKTSNSIESLVVPVAIFTIFFPVGSILFYLLKIIINFIPNKFPSWIIRIVSISFYLIGLSGLIINISMALGIIFSDFGKNSLFYQSLGVFLIVFNILIYHYITRWKEKLKGKIDRMTIYQSRVSIMIFIYAFELWILVDNFKTDMLFSKYGMILLIFSVSLILIGSILELISLKPKQIIKEIYKIGEEQENKS